MIIQTRGLSDKWCSWMRDILSTSKSVVPVNGSPGPWINCKRGLRQGDPLSPYLFLLVADLLQTMVRSSGRVQHPIDSARPCAMLQYADDTLLVMKGELHGAQELLSILQKFSDATRLKINYNKSTMVPIHMENTLAQQCATLFGCNMESFPQNYLGLPLSACKLPASVFSTYGDKHPF